MLALCAFGASILILLKILFFGTVTQLTLTSVDIDSVPINIEISEPLNVITSGAYLIIDVTENIPTKDLFEIRSFASQNYPTDCVKAKLRELDGEIYILSNTGVRISNESVQLSLRYSKPFGTDLEFSKVEITSCKLIKGATVSWSNYQK